MKKILLVDDDSELRSSLHEIFRDDGFFVGEASSGTDALQRLKAESFDLVLLDMVMPGLKGMDTLAEIKKKHPRTKVILFTAFATIQHAVDAMKMGASDYIAKPFLIDELLSTTNRVIEESRFDSCLDKVGIDSSLASLANPIRRKILQLVKNKSPIRLMELAKDLVIEDHTKIIFHLKNLKEARLIEQGDDRTYTLTDQGKSLLDCLQTFEQSLRD